MPGGLLTACNDSPTAIPLRSVLGVYIRSVFKQKIGPYEVRIFVNIGPFKTGSTEAAIALTIAIAANAG